MRLIAISFVLVFASCLGTSFADERVKADNPKTWAEQCNSLCKNPMTVKLIEYKTGRVYEQKFGVVSMSPPIGCECSERPK